MVWDFNLRNQIMATIYVAYNMTMEDTEDDLNSEVSPAFTIPEDANDYADKQSNPDDWDVCAIFHPTMTQEEMIQKHLLIISDSRISH